MVLARGLFSLRLLGRSNLARFRVVISLEMANFYGQ